MSLNDGFLISPVGFTIEGYKQLFKYPLLISGYTNTFIIVIGGTLLSLAMTAVAAFCLSRKTVQFRTPLTLFMVFTMYFSGGLIPSYLVVKLLGMRNSLWALVIPGVISTYNLLIMRTSFQALPDSLDESAKLDGANDWQIFTKIAIPLSQAILAVMALFYGVALWNSWFSAVIYLSDATLWPLQVVLREILVLNSTVAMDDNGDLQKIRETIKYAMIIIATVPILFAYPFLQKYFVKGVMLGAIKG